jgi:hypothetical protein
MSALGQKRTSKHLHTMSALPPKADIIQRGGNVRFVPKADMPADPIVEMCTRQRLHFARLKLLAVVRRIIDRLAYPRR